MIRITIIEIASFLLPFALFLLWRLQTQSDAALKPTPVLRLSAAGAALAVVVMIALVVMESLRGGHEGDVYVPPQVVDGEVVPGHFEAREDDAADEDDEPHR